MAPKKTTRSESSEGSPGNPGSTIGSAETLPLSPQALAAMEHQEKVMSQLADIDQRLDRVMLDVSDMKDHVIQKIEDHEKYLYPKLDQLMKNFEQVCNRATHNALSKHFNKVGLIPDRAETFDGFDDDDHEWAPNVTPTGRKSGRESTPALDPTG